MIRVALYLLSGVLVVAAYPAAFVSATAFAALLIAGMVCLTVAVYIEDGDGYDQTPQGMEHREFEAWEREL